MHLQVKDTEISIHRNSRKEESTKSKTGLQQNLTEQKFRVQPRYTNFEITRFNCIISRNYHISPFDTNINVILAPTYQKEKEILPPL